MKRKAKYDTGVYKYLHSLGVLNQSPEVIAQAKREYWNKVKREWKKDKAKNEKSFTVSFDSNQLRDVAEAAKIHNMSRSRFIKQACLFYLQKKYLVPNSEAIQNIKTYLALNYSALQEFYETDKAPAAIAIDLLNRMQQLEQLVLQELMHPKTKK